MQLREADKKYEKPKEIKYQELPLGKKLEHIWEYYRWYFLSVIMAIVIISYIIYIIVKPTPTYSVDLLMTGTFVTTDQDTQLVNEKLHTDFDANLQLDFLDWNSENQYTMNMYTKILALASTQQLDILIVPKAVYEQYAAQENKLIVPLEGISKLEKILETHQDQLFRAVDINDNQEHIYGIKIEKLDEKLGLASDEEYILTVVESVKNVDQTVAVINYLLE